jgi:predicted house-cleaning noncanonical NTP pyrophosphatase (MazG superfamily)
MGKLVRDKIPEIIRNSGGDPKVRSLKYMDYIEALYDKLREETEELIKDRNVEEMADVLEVLKCIYMTDTRGFEGVFRITKNKVEEKGSFLKGFYLED